MPITQLADNIPRLTFFTSGFAAAGVLAWLDARRRAEPPRLFMQPTPFNVAVLQACPLLRENYEPTPLLTNGHVETIFAAMSRCAAPLPHFNCHSYVLLQLCACAFDSSAQCSAATVYQLQLARGTIVHHVVSRALTFEPVVVVVVASPQALPRGALPP